jgi:hypothetical protein
VFIEGNTLYVEVFALFLGCGNHLAYLYTLEKRVMCGICFCVLFAIALFLLSCSHV